MRQQLEQRDVRVEIQKTLARINELVVKIKKELTTMNDVVCENGHLNISVENANLILSNIIKDMGIRTEAEYPGEEEDESDNLAIPLTPDGITEKIMAAIHNSQESR